MTPARLRAKPAVAGLAWLAAYSILFTLGDAVGAWPKVETGALGNLDLLAGMVAGACLLAILVLPPRRGETAPARSSPLG